MAAYDQGSNGNISIINTIHGQFTEIHEVINRIDHICVEPKYQHSYRNDDMVTHQFICKSKEEIERRINTKHTSFIRCNIDGSDFPMSIVDCLISNGTVIK